MYNTLDSKHLDDLKVWESCFLRIFILKWKGNMQLEIINFLKVALACEKKKTWKQDNKKKVLAC